MQDTSPRPDDGKRHVFDNPRNVKLVIYAMVVLCVIAFGLDAVIHRHVDHPWEALPLFYCLYGFAACVILVLIAKEMRKVLMRDEEYYDE